MADEIKRVLPYWEMKFERLIGKGACIEPNKMYIVAFKKEFTVEEAEDLQKYLESIERNYKCKFLVLHGYGEEPNIYELELDAATKGTFIKRPVGEVEILHVHPRKFRD